MERENVKEDIHNNRGYILHCLCFLCMSTKLLTDFHIFGGEEAPFGCGQDAKIQDKIQDTKTVSLSACLFSCLFLTF